MTHVTPGITEYVKTFSVMCSTSLRDRWNGTVQIVKKYTLTDDYDFRFILAELSNFYIILFYIKALFLFCTGNVSAL